MRTLFDRERTVGADARPKVLFVLGKGRSGSTLLGSILGGVEGLFNAGELRRIWDWGLVNRYLCGCGVLVPDCSVWGRVLAELEDEGSLPGPEEAARLTREVTSWWNVYRLLQGPDRAIRGWPGAERWIELMGRVYRAAARVTGARVIVDTTKIPVNPLLSADALGLDVYMVQLVRDPRGVTYSWRRHKRWTDRKGEGEMSRYGPVYTGAGWVLRNVGTELVRRWVPSHRSMTLRYEDLMADPYRWTTRLIELVEEAEAGTPFVGERTVELASNHAVAGNPDRVGRREVTIREDVEWKERIRPRDALVTTAFSIPLLHRYGYPWRTGIGTKSGSGHGSRGSAGP